MGDHPSSPSSPPLPEPARPAAGWRELARKALAPLVALGLLIAKFKWILFAVFKLKLFATSASMLVSLAAYAWLWGWRFGLGFVVLLLVHELGHVVELRRQGIPASAPLFIPFLGAVVGMKQLPPDAWREARVALAGPILGSLGTLPFWIAGEALDSDLLVALAFTGFFINLFNLLPIVPLDGGRALAAVHPALWAVGFAALLALVLFRPNPVLLIILLLGSFELWQRWRRRHEPQAASYYRIGARRRVTAGLVYLALVALLALGSSATHIEREL